MCKRVVRGSGVDGGSFGRTNAKMSLELASIQLYNRKLLSGKSKQFSNSCINIVSNYYSHLSYYGPAIGQCLGLYVYMVGLSHPRVAQITAGRGILKSAASRKSHIPTI